MARLSAGGRGKRIGLMGGSFNPAHGGHVAISRFALQRLRLDEVWWLVSPGNPLKTAQGMAPLPARLKRAQEAARRARIRPTAIEAKLGTRYTVDTLRKITQHYPKNRFIWLMGADNLAQFHRWKDWRKIACTMPIAVISRPSYNEDAVAAPAMAWLGHFVRRSDQSALWTHWSYPALVRLRFLSDSRSATAIRAKNPFWFKRYDDRPVRDGLTRRLLK